MNTKKNGKNPRKIKKMDHSSASSSSSSFSESSQSENEFCFQLNPEEKAMSNSLVIRRLLRSLSAADLLKCRLLNRQWRDESTYFLLQLLRFERSLQVSFEWCEPHNCFQHGHSGRTLNEFHTLLRQSRGFPSTFFRFVGGNLKSYDSASFFQENGSMIKSLCLGFKTEKRRTNVMIMSKLFYEWAPNIKYLAVESPKNLIYQYQNSRSFFSNILLQMPTTPTTASSSRENPNPNPNNKSLTSQLVKKEEEPRPLRNLEILDLNNQESHLQLTHDIFKVAVNLKETIDPQLKFINELTKNGKISTVKSLSVFEDLITENIDLFSKCSPKLQEIRIKASAKNESIHRRIKFKTILEDVLESSKDTLEKISQLNPITCLYPMKIPVMKNVKFLGVKVKSANTSNSSETSKSKEAEILPAGRNIQEIFPNLEELHLRTSRRAKGTVMALNIKKPLPFVHTVHAHVNSLTCDFLQKLSKFCPNLTVLHIIRISIENFPSTMRSLWSCFPGVRELEMSLSYWVNPFGADVLNECDSAMTGFSKQVVQKLRKGTKTDAVKVLKKNKRERPSILDLKNLTYFKLTVQDTTLDSLPIFSKVTNLYALNSMKSQQNLIVDIKSHFDLQPMFEPDVHNEF